MMQIKGEYEVSILIQNMFHSYTITTRNSNIVTNEGLNFILQVLKGTPNYQLGEVWVGKNTTEASILDTVNSFISPKKIPKDRIEVENNTLTYIIQTDGNNIHETTEIGIWSEDEQTLITRDVHDRYDVPNSAVITVKYSLTLSNKTETIGEEVEEEENSND